MADYQRVLNEQVTAPHTMSTNPTVEHHQEDESPPATAAFYHVPSTWGESDSSTSSEYLDASTPGKSDDGDVPDGMGDAGRSDAPMSYTRTDGMPFETRSHIIPIDSPTPDPFPYPSVPHPNVGLEQLQRHMKAIIVYTLLVDEKQPLADAEAQASSYVAKFIANFESQPSTKLNAAGYLYSCKKERLIQILSDNHPSPPRIVRRVCHVIHETLLYSEYGKYENHWPTLISWACIFNAFAFLFNMAAWHMNDPTGLATSIVMMMSLFLCLKYLFYRWAEPSSTVWEKWKSRPWVVRPDVFEVVFKWNMVLVWAVPVLLLVLKFMSGLVWLVVVVFRFLIA